MKKTLSILFLFILCSIVTVIPQTNIVNAATKDDFGDVVYYQAIVKKYKTNDSPLRGVTVISQNYYKNDSMQTIEMEDGNFKPLTNTELCNNYSDIKSSCNNNSPGALAELKINNFGDFDIQLQPNVEIANLRIYYIIANRSNEAQLFCTGSDLCEKAKKIKNENGTSNWKSYSSSGNFVYTTSTIGSAFEKVEYSSGGVGYVDFNIFDKMQQNYSQLAAATSGEEGSLAIGLYVVTSMTIKYNDTDYYVNDYTLAKKTFSSIGSMEGTNPIRQIITNNNPTQKGVSDSVLTVTNNAALIIPKTGVDASSNKTYNTANQYFKDTLRPIFSVVIGIMFIITGGMTTITIVKSSDEPEVRRSAIKKLIGLFTGALIIVLIMWYYETIINVVNGFIQG